MSKIRVSYSKTGKAKYISHLDLITVMQRAFLRAGFRLKYSEGFNPHPSFSVALPLPVGCGSLCELMDIGLDGISQTGKPDIGFDGVEQTGKPDIGFDVISQTCTIADRLNKSLPDGLHIIDAYEAERKFKEISWIRIGGILYYDRGAAPDMADRLEELLSRESIVIVKKTKRGASEIDVAPYIKDARTFDSGVASTIESGVASTIESVDASTKDSIDAIKMTAMISAQNPTINTDDVMSIINGAVRLKPDHSEFTRLEVFDGSLKIFK